MSSPQPSLNPAQKQILTTIGAPASDRPTFREQLQDDIRDELEHRFGELLNENVETPIYLSKHTLTQLHACEAKFIAEQATDFAWTVPMARGVVAHKVLELNIGRSEQHAPLDLIEEAIQRLGEEQRPLAEFLNELDSGDRAQLTADANEMVTAFFETFPPIKRSWRPVVESRVKATFFDEAVVLAGKVDLTLGHANGMTAGKVLFDVKTGRINPSHVEDLRFYALLETLRVGTPPRLLVNYYLETGTPQVIPVTEELLYSTTRRIADAFAVYVDLMSTDARPPTTSPGPLCRWCPANLSCEPGQAFLAGADEQADDVYD